LPRPVTASHIELLDRYRQWLLDEALPAGGLGPNERERIDERHIVDSLLFAVALAEPASVWDVGTGVGLPGIPLAVLLSETEFTLIDRSERRTRLTRRAARILDLDNVRVVTGDVNAMTESADAIVSRASMPPDAMARVCAPHLRDQGVIVVGGSWVSRPEVEGWTTLTIDVLDRVVWLLMMRAA
jgi:16S rRNA (guanine527-N7)-methyltransferase